MMTTADTILAIDAGTSRTKAAIFDLAGNSLGIASQDMTILHPFEGACEMSMEAVWDAVCMVCRELAQRYPDQWKNLRGVAVTGQGDGLWPLDADGNPLGNAMLWNDNRVKRLALENEEEVTRYGIDNSLCPLFAGAVPLLMRWMQDKEPTRFKKLAHALHCKDWLVYRLTGEIITDRTDASTALLNILTGEYAFDLLTLLGLPREKICGVPPGSGFDCCCWQYRITGFSGLRIARRIASDRRGTGCSSGHVWFGCPPGRRCSQHPWYYPFQPGHY